MTNVKTCTKCGETKATTEFYKHKGKKDGLQSVCKPCLRIYRKTPAAKAIARKASSKVYAAMTKVQRKAKDKKFLSKFTVAELKARKCVSNARIRSDLSSADLYGGLTFTEACAMTEVFAKERLRLEVETGVAHHVDHIIPLAAGGTHTADNLQVLTAAENVAKGAS